MRKRTVAPERSKALGPVRVAIYLRVSTAKQLKGYGLEVQHDECIAWLDYKIGKGKYLAEVYTDGAVSGKLAKRPDLDEMNDDIASKKYDIVAFGKLDRIGRTMKDIHRWVYDTTDIEAVPGVKVRVATADGRIDSEDEMFGIQLSLLAYMAELEHAMILDRTLGGREKKLEKGGWPAGVAPYGLMLDGKGEKAKPVPNEAEVEVLEKACDLIIDLRKNAEEAARELNTLNKFTRQGRPWTGANLIQRLMSTSLDGYIIYRNMGRTGGTAAKRDDEGNPLYGDTVHIPVPRVLKEERLAAVRKALSSRSFTKKGEKQYLLSTRVVGMCGNHYVGTYREIREHVRYRCTGKKLSRHGQKACACKEIDAAELERAVWGEVEQLLGGKAKLRELAQEWLGAIPSRVKAYRQRIAELDELIAKKKKSRKAKIMALLSLADDDEADLDEDTIEELKSELKDQEAELQKLRDDTEEWLREAETQEAHVAGILDLVESVKPELEAFTHEQRIDLLNLLNVRVEIMGEVPGQVRAAGCPFEAWLKERNRTVPAVLTDGQWERIKHVFPEPKKPGRAIDPRTVFEGSLHKLRHGVTWRALPSSEYGKWHTIYQRALDWFQEGVWTKAVEELGEYAGTPVPPLYQLPPLKITGSFDPRLTVGGAETGEGLPEQSSRILFAWVTPGIETMTAA